MPTAGSCFDVTTAQVAYMTMFPDHNCKICNLVLVLAALLSGLVAVTVWAAWGLVGVLCGWGLPWTLYSQLCL